MGEGRTTRAAALGLWHPRVLVAYFACALVLVMAAFEPVCTGLGLAVGLLVCCRLRGVRATLRPLAWQLPLMVIICLVNPFFSAQGMTEVATVGVRKVYLESLAYGLNMGAMLLAMLVWFADAAAVVSTDAVRIAFGGTLPVVSLMVSMTVRLVPDFIRRGHEIADVQRACTSAAKTNAPLSDLSAHSHPSARSRLHASSRLHNRSRLVTVLVGWGLEDSFATADSMQARGWSSARRRTSYRSQRFRTRDGVALALIATLATVDALALARVCGGWHYYPTMGSFSAWWLYLPHAVLLALPLVATAVEDLRWSHAESSERAAA